MVPRTGVEPARPKSSTRPSTLRVYQFHHLGIKSECKDRGFGGINARFP